MLASVSILFSLARLLDGIPAWCSQVWCSLLLWQQSPVTGIAATVVDPTMFFRDTDQMVRQVSSFGLTICQNVECLCKSLCP